tara:strand:- start:100 stop:216 length:117 start_codon:yes stop_codon:yes gene_type:complete
MKGKNLKISSAKPFTSSSEEKGSEEEEEEVKVSKEPMK